MSKRNRRGRKRQQMMVKMEPPNDCDSMITIEENYEGLQLKQEKLDEPKTDVGQWCEVFGPQDKTAVSLYVGASFPLPTISSTAVRFWNCSFEAIPNVLLNILQREGAYSANETVGFVRKLEVAIPGKTDFVTPALVILSPEPWISLTLEVIGEAGLDVCTCYSCVTYPFKPKGQTCVGGVRSSWQDIKQNVLQCQIMPALSGMNRNECSPPEPLASIPYCEPNIEDVQAADEDVEAADEDVEAADEDGEAADEDEGFVVLSEAEDDDEMESELPKEDKPDTEDLKNSNVGFQRGLSLSRRPFAFTRRKRMQCYRCHLPHQVSKCPVRLVSVRVERGRGRGKAPVNPNLSNKGPVKCYRCKQFHYVGFCDVKRIVDPNWKNNYVAIDGEWVPRSALNEPPGANTD